MIDRELFDKANDVLRVCQTSQLTVATVESCTGGLVSAALTDVPGSSSVMDRGFVTYTNEAKTQLVGVPQGLFPKVGAVSEEVAREMAMGGLEQSMADISVAVTGVAGPGQSELKPAGLVHIAAARREGTTLYQEHRFQGDRQAVRKASVLAALDLVARLANSRPGARARVAGVDFSGARLAGSKIWISEGWNGADGVEIYRLLPASALPNGDKPMQPALTALVAHLKTLGDSIIGLDFPFSLPRTLIPQKDWETFVRNFPNRFRDADAFRETCRAEACKRELKRETDIEAAAPFATYNKRLFKQTWAGIGLVLAPLVRNDLARVIPFQPVARTKPVLAEICPASFLKDQGLYKPPYKGRSGAHEERRRAILGELVERRMLRPLRDDLKDKTIRDHSGDVLDSLLAAVSVARIREYAPQRNLDQIEGRIYF